MAYQFFWKLVDGPRRFTNTLTRIDSQINPADFPYIVGVRKKGHLTYFFITISIIVARIAVTSGVMYEVANLIRFVESKGQTGKESIVR
jgi:hypothetical protein